MKKTMYKFFSLLLTLQVISISQLSCAEGNLSTEAIAQMSADTARAVTVALEHQRNLHPEAGLTNASIAAIAIHTAVGAVIPLCTNVVNSCSCPHCARIFDTIEQKNMHTIICMKK
jgi:protein-disulfide isomerase